MNEKPQKKNIMILTINVIRYDIIFGFLRKAIKLLVKKINMNMKYKIL